MSWCFFEDESSGLTPSSLIYDETGYSSDLLLFWSRFRSPEPVGSLVRSAPPGVYDVPFSLLLTWPTNRDSPAVRVLPSSPKQHRNLTHTSARPVSFDRYLAGARLSLRCAPPTLRRDLTPVRRHSGLGPRSLRDTSCTSGVLASSCSSRRARLNP